MYKKAKRLITVCLILFCVLQTAISQNLTVSPYSYYEPGELQFMGNASNLAKGRVSQGIRRPYEINSLNPASYSGLKNTIIEAGFAQNNGTIKDSASLVNVTTVGFSYVNFGIPISEKRGWGFSFGLMPFSSIGYNVIRIDSIPQDTFNMPITYNYLGKGGLTKFYIGMGYKVYKDSVRSLSLGVNVGYIFGNLNSTKQTLFSPIYLKFNTEEATNRYTGGLIFDYGLQFEQLLSKKNNPKRTTLVAGLTMNARTELSSTRQYVLRTLAIGGGSRSGGDVRLDLRRQCGRFPPERRPAAGGLRDANRAVPGAGRRWPARGSRRGGGPRARRLRELRTVGQRGPAPAPGIGRRGSPRDRPPFAVTRP